MSDRVRSTSRARRVLGVIGAVVGTTVTFVGSAAAAVIVHLDVPVTRRLVVTQVNAVLKETLTGEITIERIGGLGLGGVSGVRARVKDGDGVQVLFVDGVRVRVAALAAARSALFGSGDIQVRVDAVSIDHIDVALDGDAAGQNLRLANAFTPKPDDAPKKPSSPGRGVSVEAPEVRLGHAWFHGAPPGAPRLDGELASLEASAHYDPKAVRARLAKVSLVTRGLPNRVDPRGILAARIDLSLVSEGMDLEASFDGFVAEIPATAHAHLDGKKVDARVDVARAPGARLGAILGGEALASDASLHAEAHGTLPKLAAKAKVGLGRGTVDVDANVELGDATRIDATVAARHVDLREALASLPPSDLGLDARGAVTIGPNGALSGQLSLETLPGLLYDDRLPVVHARAAATEDMAWASARVVDSALPAEVAVVMVPEGNAKILDAQVRADVKDLTKIPKIGGLVRGSAVVRGDARLNLETKGLIAHADVVATNVSQGKERAARVVARATAAGSLDRVVVDGAVLANGIVAGGIPIDSVDATARITTGEGLVVEHPAATITKNESRVVASAARVIVSDGSIGVEDAAIEGIGDPIRADFDRNASRMRVRLAAPSIDLVKVARLVGVGPVDGGIASVRGDVTLDASGDARGALHAKVEGLTSGRLKNGVVTADVTLDRRDIELDLGAALEGIATLSMKTQRLHVGGRIDDPRSWESATGRCDLSADIDLSRVSSLVPDGMLPIGELGGELVVRGAAWRRNANVAPATHFTAYTRGLVVAGPTPPEPELGLGVKGVAPWRSQDLDLAVDLRADAESDDEELSVRIHDRHGNVAALDVKAILPLDAMMSDPAGALAKAERAPLAVRLVVPERPLAWMPAILGTKNALGTVSADVFVSGTALEPQVVLSARARGVKTSVFNVASNADVSARYDGKTADLEAHVSSKKKETLALTSHADIALRDVLSPQAGQELPWGASAKVTLDEFPLQTFAFAADQRIRGLVSGRVSVDDLHKDAKVAGELAMANLRIGGVKYDKGRVKVAVGGGKASASLRIDQSDGFVEAGGTAGLAWGTALVPTFDAEKPLEAKLETKNFRAAALQPFVQGPIAELDGRIDANASAQITPNDAKLSGKVQFRDGTLGLTALGGSFRDVKGTVTLAEDGSITVTDVGMRDAEGQLTASGHAKLSGFRLASADAQIDIPKGKPLDLALQGAPLGRVSASAKIAVTGSPDGKKLAVVVDVPRVDAELPPSLKTGLQDLNPVEKIAIGVYRKPGEFVKLPFDAKDLRAAEPKKEGAGTQVEIDIKLGDVTVVRGNQAKIIATGAPHISIGDTTKVSGRIELKQGTIDVQGKEFTVERGFVTFQPTDPGNPVIVATATWTAEDGTKIYADFTGPVKTGKVNLRSEPSRPKNEILAMILFGTADGMGGTPQSGGRSPDGRTQAATAVGGGFAAQGLTEALDDLAGIHAQARIDSTNANNPRPELEVQVAKNISVKVGHVLGTPPITDPDVNLATVEWRFRRAWSLATTFGDRGKAQADVVWQKRY